MELRGRVTKNVILVTWLSGWAASRKRNAGAGFLALIRYGIPLSGSGSGENETQFRFLRAEKTARIGFARHGVGENLVQIGAEKQ